MSVRTDQVNINVNINGNAAQNQLNELRKKSAEIAASMVGLKKSTQEWIDKNTELNKVNTQMAELKKTIGLTSLNLKELANEQKKLNALFINSVPGSAEYKAYSKQLDKVASRIYNVKNNVSGLGAVFSKVKDEIKQFGVLALGYLGFQFITEQFKNIIQGAGKLSDQLADLRRVAGLTAEEANNLNKSLGGIDTRTSVSALRNIAIIAGKLGVAKEDIFSFTQAVDQLVVTLGDELGNADQITTQLGKILNVFDGKVTGDNISKLGNSFVQLANTGAATGGFIADFDQRLSGIAKSAGIGLGALSGLGAGLEEMGSKVESSSTAIQKLIISIAADIPGAAKIAGLSAKEFNKLFATDGTEAILRYSEGLVKNKKSFADVTASLKDAGEEGVRTIETISKLGINADVLRGRIDLGKKSMEDSAAITAAFALKNQTFGASLDKLGKEFNSLVTSSSLTNFLKGGVEAVVSFIAALKKVPQFIDDNSLALKFLLAGIVLLNFSYIKSAAVIARDTILKIQNAVVTKATAIATALAEVATASYIVVTNLLTGRIALATAAQRLWSIALSVGLGPLGIIVTLIGAAIIAFNAFASASSNANKALSFQSETLAATNKELAKQKGELESLTSIAKDNNVSSETRHNILQKLIAISPEYLNRLTLENIATADGKRILDNYNKSLEASGNIKAANMIRDREAQKDADLRAIKQELEIAKSQGKGFGDLSSEAQGAFSKVTTSVGRTNFTSGLLNSSISKADFQTAFDDINKQINEQSGNVKATTTNFLNQTQAQQDARRAFFLTEITASRTAQNNARDEVAKYQEGTKEYITATAAYGKATQALVSIRNKFDQEFGNKKTKNNVTDLQDNTLDAIGLIAELQAKIKKLDDARPNLLTKKAITENLAERKKLQDQLDALEGKTAGGSKSGDNKYAELKKEYAAFLKELEKLKIDSATKALPADQEEIQKVENKYNLLLQKAVDYYNKLAAYDKNKPGLLASDKKALDKNINVINGLKMTEVTGVVGEQDYKKSLAFSEQYFEEKKKQAVTAYGDGVITEKQYQDQLQEIERNAVLAKIKINEDYVGFAKSAEGGLVAEKKRLYELDGKNYTEAELKKAQALKESQALLGSLVNDEALAQTKVKVLTARPGSSGELAAKKQLLQLETAMRAEELRKQYDLSEESWKAGNALYDQLQQERIKSEDQLDTEYFQAKFDNVMKYVNAASSALSSINDILNNAANRELANDRKVNADKQKNLKNQLDKKLISQAQYDKKIQALNDEQAKKESEARKKQAEREKALAIFQALISTASAVVAALGAKPWGPQNFVYAGLVGALGALQIAAIASAPPPEAAEGNWFRKGPKHKDPEGGIHVLIERDEAVVKAAAMTDNKKYTVTGTPAQITSKVNSMHGGVNWAPGALIQMPKFRERPAQINPNLPRIMAEGGVGVVRQLFADKQQQTPAHDERVVTLLEKVLEATGARQNSIRSHVVLSDIHHQSGRYNQSKKASGLG